MQEFLAKHVASIGTRTSIILGVVLIVVIALGLTYCAGRGDGKRGEIVNQQEREIEVLQEVGKANTTAAEQRVEDAKEAFQQEKDLTDALESTTDPVARRALRGCIIMRQQGRDTDSIPACAGLAPAR